MESKSRKRKRESAKSKSKTKAKPKTNGKNKTYTLDDYGNFSDSESGHDEKKLDFVDESDSENAPDKVVTDSDKETSDKETSDKDMSDKDISDKETSDKEKESLDQDQDDKEPPMTTEEKRKISLAKRATREQAYKNFQQSIKINEIIQSQCPISSVQDLLKTFKDVPAVRLKFQPWK